MSALKYRPFAKPGERSVSSAARPVIVPEIEQIPSIDDFLDELPAIEDFLMAEQASEPYEESDAYEPPSVEVTWQPEESPAQPVGADGWVTGSWQFFDWSSAAALNRRDRDSEAARSWGESSWPSSQPLPAEQSTADEVADALVGIARRIRSGELVIDNLKGTPPEAAMAAALAVILKMRG